MKMMQQQTLNAMQLKNKKITKTTFKSFIRKTEKLYIRKNSNFDGMTDCVQPTGKKEFTEAETTERHTDHTLGIRGVWLVNRGADYFEHYEDDIFEGIEVFNSCGSFIVARKK